MLNITIVCIVFMMMLTVLFYTNMNIDLKVALADLKSTNPFRYHNMMREAYHRFIASIDDNGKSKAESTWRYREALACGYSRDEAEEAKNNPEWEASSRLIEKKHPHIGKKRFGFTLIRNLTTKEHTICVRGWCALADFDGFNIDAFGNTDSIVILDWRYLHDNKEELPMEFEWGGKNYIILGASQGGLKHGTCVGFEKTFVDRNIDKLCPEWAKELSTQKQCQRISLMLSCAERTDALIENIIILPAFSRIDKFADGEGLYVKHTGDETKPYVVERTGTFNNALIDGFAFAGKDAGLGKRKFAIIRPTKGMCAIIDVAKYGLDGVTVVDYFGNKRIITNKSIVVTTDCVKDIKAFTRNGGHLERERWMNAQPSKYVYACNTHTASGKIRLARQMTDKFTQIQNVKNLIDMTVAHDLSLFATEHGYKDKLKESYRVLKLDEMKPMLNSMGLFDAICDKVVGLYHDVVGGGILVRGSCCYGIADLEWVTDVYGWHFDDENVEEYSRTAGRIPRGCVCYGKGLVDMNNVDDKGLPLGKDGKPVYIVVGRFPQINPKMMLMRVIGDAEIAGCISFSMQDMEDALINLDADLDGDEFMCIEDNEIIEAVRIANERFGFKTIVYETMQENPAAKHCSLQQYMKWALELSQVGLAVYPIFEQMELIPLLKEDEDWRTIKIPIYNRKEGWKRRYLEKLVENDIPIVSCQGHDATDAAKHGGKGGKDKRIMEWYNPAPMSHDDAKRTPLSENRARLSDIANAANVRVNDGIIARIKAEVLRRGLKLEARHLENGGIKEYPTFVKKPVEAFEGVDASVWKKQLRPELMVDKLVLKKDGSEVIRQFADNFLQGMKHDSDAKQAVSSVYSIVDAFTVASELQKTSVREDERDVTKEVKVDLTSAIIAFIDVFCKQNNIVASANEKVWMAYNGLAKTFFSKNCAEAGWLIGQFLTKFSDCIKIAVDENSGRKTSTRKDKSEVEESSQQKINIPKASNTDASEPVENVEAETPVNFDKMIAEEAHVEEFPEELLDEAFAAELMAKRKKRGGFGKKKQETAEDIFAAMESIDPDTIPEE